MVCSAGLMQLTWLLIRKAELVLIAVAESADAVSEGMAENPWKIWEARLRLLSPDGKPPPRPKMLVRQAKAQPKPSELVPSRPAAQQSENDRQLWAAFGRALQSQRE